MSGRCESSAPAAAALSLVPRPNASARAEIPFATTIGAFTVGAAAVAPVPAALLVEEFCARTRGREYANAAAPNAAATATTLIRRKSFSVPVPHLLSLRRAGQFRAGFVLSRALSTVTHSRPQRV